MSDEAKALASVPDYRTEIAQLLRVGVSTKGGINELFKYHENDIADALILLDENERRAVYDG